MRTAELRHLDFALELLRRGANVNVRDNQGRTSLRYAVDDNNDEMVDLLLKWGAKVNVRDKDGHTPLTASLVSDEDRTGEVTALLRKAGGKQ